MSQLRLLKEKFEGFSFMRYRKPMLILSCCLMVISLLFFGARGINLGLDFTGGTVVEVGYDTPISLAQVRSVLTEAGHPGALVQYFGDDRTVLVSVKDQEEKALGIGRQIFEAAREARPDAVLRRSEFIGAQVGAELQEKGGLALLLALAIILIYIAFRFQLKFACSAILALIHDVLLVLGFFSLLGLEFDLSVLAALLAVIGYSLNDTLVVSDRIRENFREVYLEDVSEVMDISLRQVFGRTLITSFTTLLVLLALCIFGGEGIRNFALALTFGVIVGTYSSIYICASTLLLLNIKREDLIPEDKKTVGL